MKYREETAEQASRTVDVSHHEGKNEERNQIGEIRESPSSLPAVPLSISLVLDIDQIKLC